jgi:amino acid transporter
MSHLNVAASPCSVTSNNSGDGGYGASLVSPPPSSLGCINGSDDGSSSVIKVPAMFSGLPSTGNAERGGGDDASSTPPASSADLGVSKKLTWYKMAFICFIFTAGGPFGLESVVQSGGPLLAIIGTVGIVLVHVTPMILIVTELSGMMPTNRGSVEWIDRAYGHEVGFVSSLLQAIINMIDLSVYPVMVRGYVEQKFHLGSEGVRYLVGLGILLLASIPSFFSTSDLGNFAFVCMGLTISPFVVGFIYGVKEIDPSAWGEIKAGPIDISTLMAVSIWMYTGFMALGNLGGEVESPKVFLVGCGSAAILDCIMYLLPLIVTLQVQGSWDDGFFADAFDHILPGLGWAILGAGGISGYAMYASSLTCYSRTLWGIADKRWLPQFLTKTIKRTGAPWAAMLVYVGCCCVLILFDFDFLVTLELVISAANFLLFYTGFMLLRYREPEAHRPWRVPGGKLAMWAMISPIVTIYAALFISGVVVWQYGVALGGVVVLLVVVYFVFVRRALQQEASQLLQESPEATEGPPPSAALTYNRTPLSTASEVATPLWRAPGST